MSNLNQAAINKLLEALDLLGWSPTEIEVPEVVKPPLVEERPDVPDQRPTLAWGAKVSSVFRDRVWWIADELTKQQGSLFDANWLMSCMAFETGERFTADVKNPASSATGLIQFMDSTAKALKTTTAKLAKMTAEDQLNYVYKYFRDMIKAKGPIRSLDDCYMAILWPAGIGKPSEYKLWIKGSSQYAVNAGLDKNKDSVVTKAEAAAKVVEKLVKGLQSQYAA
jgi:hypothetical protein